MCGLSIETWQIVIIVVQIVQIFVFIWLKSYFTEKGRNLATKQDIEDITEKVETVKDGFTKNQKWWDKKAEVYTNVIEALYDSRSYSASILEADREGKELTEEESKELVNRLKIAEKVIGKTVVLGSFLLSSDALARLKVYQKESEKASQTSMWYDYLFGDFEATDNCLKDLIEIAKRDLMVK